MKLIAAPDSFKGTVSSEDAGRVILSAFALAFEERGLPAPEARSFVMADGGEGTVKALTGACGGRVIGQRCAGPDPGQTVDGFFGLLPDGSAVVELAAAAALTQTALRDPERTTTYGAGQLIEAALDHSPKKLILAIGGSATNDCGCGMAAALGVRFLRSDGSEFVPAGGTLKDVAAVDMSGLDGRIKGLPVEVMCDVRNPLCGRDGAAAVFAPQKGADEEAVKRLDSGLGHIARIWADAAGTGADGILSMPGGGAAGGCGAGAVMFLSASLRSGADVVLDAAGFDAALKGAGLVITGEGRFDGTSLGGKAVGAVAARCRAAGVPCAVLAGAAEPMPYETLREAGITAVFSSQRALRTREELAAAAKGDIYETALNMARLWIDAEDLPASGM